MQRHASMLHSNFMFNDQNSVPRNCREPNITLEEEVETQTPSSRDDERRPATGQAA